MQTQISGADLAEIVEAATTMMLGIDIGDVVEDAQFARACSVGAAVAFSGNWVGGVVIGCDDVLGRDAAGAMFAKPAKTVTDDEIGDAIGELANMVAGNVKPLLPATATLSVPTVVHGEDIRLAIPGAHIWATAVFRRGGSELSVYIYERPSREPRS